jgi:hypothetical protein
MERVGPRPPSRVLLTISGLPKPLGEMTGGEIDEWTERYAHGLVDQARRLQG